MRLIIDMKMLDESWHVGTKFAMSELSYQHTLMEGCADHLLQFDVTRVDISAGSNQGGGELSQAGQKLVELRLISDNGVEGLIIQNVTLKERAQRARANLAPYWRGSDAPIRRTVFLVKEWDYYGRHGTWSRTWHVFSSTVGNWFFDFLPIFILFGIVSVCFFLILRIVGRRRRGAEGASQDVEAAFLGPEKDTELLQETSASEEPPLNYSSSSLPQKSVEKSESEGPMAYDPKPSLLD